ncbi:hypothetical protein [Trichococcus shcherbakoviae]|uniref:hypothetical protein n=1 Tax=Trichococcus shcherbakoviae TaxID=2094020 RepID=UPI002AA8AA8F|nr:hypothetical protein [Trichococcus shcherbakoviae]
MKKTTNELHTQSALIFQEVQSISRYTSLIKAIDDNIYELACSYDAIDANHPKAAAMKHTIANLTSLNALLLEGFGERSEKLEEMADALTMDLSKGER